MILHQGLKTKLNNFVNLSAEVSECGIVVFVTGFGFPKSQLCNWGFQNFSVLMKAHNVQPNFDPFSSPCTSTWHC